MFKGFYKSNVIDGQVEYYFHNDKVYEGLFKDNEIIEGTMYDNDYVYKGKFIQYNPIDKHDKLSIKFLQDDKELQRVSLQKQKTYTIQIKTMKIIQEDQKKKTQEIPMNNESFKLQVNVYLKDNPI